MHSPFAFRFITECLREKLPYYAYASFSGLEQCLAFRLAVFFQPEKIVGIGKGVERLVKAAKKGCPKAMPSEASAVAAFEGVCKKMCIAGPAGELSGSAFCDGDVVYVVANARAVCEMQACLDALGFGMSFIDGDSAVFAIFSPLPRQTFYPRLC